MPPSEPGAGIPAKPSDDVVQPFRLNPAPGVTFQGRMIRLGGVIDSIVSRHGYPATVARVLGEAMALTAALAAALKYEGIFTFQIKADGPVSLLVTDVTSTGNLRGYAQYDANAVAGLDAADATARQIFGDGHLAFTVDQGEHTERYQGLVELVGDTMPDFAQHYFRQSAQLDAALMVTSGPSSGAAAAAGPWRATALMIQRLPEANAALRSDDADDPWRRAMLLMATATPDELLSGDLGAPKLLHRLFHQEGLIIDRERPLRDQCRCSEARILSILRTLPDLEDGQDDPTAPVEVTCEFCSTKYSFDPQKLRP